MAAAMILPTAAACGGPSNIAFNGAPAAFRTWIQAVHRLQKQLHPYAALGIGYRDEHKQAVGLVVLHYAHAGEAAADLSIRRSLAQNGYSLATGELYRKVLFTVEGASVTGSDLVLRLRPFNNQPRRLFEMVANRDTTFAVCP